jgi:geranylgeranyl reductase family protein
MTRWDVLIVGAGPAGSTAARLLAGGGARVCLVDKARFPRSKPCGGALSPRILRHLPTGIQRLIRARVQRAVFTFQSRKPFEVVSPTPMGYMICREEFDTWLRGEAEAAGACVREGIAVRDLEESDGRFAGRAGRELVTAGTLIGADGANSLVASRFLPDRPAARYVAVEAEVPRNGAAPGETVLVDVGSYPGGYAWAFPKGDRINMGVMLDHARGGALRGALASFIAGQPALPAVGDAALHAAPVAAPRATPVPCARPGVLLVGDAARLADPFLGEGIYSAVRSGALAAQAILAGAGWDESARRYADQVALSIWPDLMAASRIAALFHRMPRWWHYLCSRMPGSLSGVVNVLAGEESYRGLLRQIVQRVEMRANRWVRAQLGVRPGGGAAGSGETNGGAR